ncbi:heme NO-binding domain-containing protein [Pseudooceanicola sp. C21-150M6]|uniref:heme NO-binding domain-containing protein n=1 Tax=Pseudooceanicola sp. C21-150M6 TaxID=3434355 RepID=UPI003D7F5BE6
MHGLINRAIQCFLRDTYGPDVWYVVARQAGVADMDFAAMLHYDDAVTEQVLTAAAGALTRPRDSILEDLGTYLVCNENMEGLRRLLRFAGTTYEEFLLSLEDLPGRARLAVSDLELPELELRCDPDDSYVLSIGGGPQGFGLVMVGILRALADDYGALVLLDYGQSEGGQEQISLRIVTSAYSQGRQFHLAAAAADAQREPAS